MVVKTNMTSSTVIVRLSPRHHAMLQELSIMQARTQAAIIRDATVQYIHASKQNKQVQFVQYYKQREAL